MKMVMVVVVGGYDGGMLPRKNKERAVTRLMTRGCQQHLCGTP